MDIDDRFLSYLTKILIPVFIFVGLFLSSLYSYLLFHTLVELFSITIAGAIFVLAWNFRRFYQNSFLTFIGTAYLFCSFIDLVHALGYKGMSIFQGYDANLPTQLWIAARYLQGVSLLAAPLFLKRKVKMSWLLAGFSLATTLLMLSIFVWNIFPACFVEGAGLTPFKITSEYVIDLILVITILILLHNRRSIDRSVLRWMILSIGLTMLSELAFTFYVSVYGFSNLVGHFGKIISYYLFYKAIIETETGKIYADMTQLRDTESALRASELQAQRSLVELRSVYAHTPVGLCFFDAKLCYQAINDLLAEINGRPASEHIGKCLHDILPAEIARKIEPSLHYVLKTGKPVLNQNMSGSTHAQTAQKRHWLVSYHPVVEAEGTTLGVSCVVQDVTEHRRAEEALQSSEERFHTLIDEAPIAIALSRDSKFLYVNPAYLKMHGIASADELIGRTIFERVAPESVAMSKERADHRQQRLPVEKNYEYVALHKDGSRTPTIAAVTRVNLADGPATVGFFQDITVRKQAEDRINRQNAILTGINRIFQEALTCQTEEELGEVCLSVAEQVTNSRFGFIAKVNQQTGQLDDIAISDPGWDACQMPDPAGHGKKLPTGLLIHGIYGQVLQNNQGFFTNDPPAHPSAIGTPPGHPPLQSFIGVPFIYNRNAIGMLAMGNRPGGYGVEDLEALEILAPAIVQALMNKRAEHALRESEKRFRSVVESNMIGVVFADPETGAVTDANDEYLRIIGRSRKELEAGAIHWREITPPEGLEQAEQARFQLPRGHRKRCFDAAGRGEQRQSQFENEFIRPDGSQVPVIIGGSYLDDELHHIVAFVLDNTERKRMTEELAQANLALKDYAEKLKYSNQELEQFAFIASHDLQEPLRKVKMFGNRLQSQMKEASPAGMSNGALDSLQRMQNAAERMQKMVDGLLELSRIHTRGGTFEPTELRPVVEDVLYDLEARIQATGGQVIVGNLYSAEVDGDQIRRLFQNLIGNALKFHKPGVPPLIAVNGIITRFPQASMITITVKDNGIGFEERYAERIFQPFQRLHGKEEYEGTGLGLSICQKIVERHHGTIEAHSQPGEGSVFQICLPIQQPESER